MICGFCKSVIDDDSVFCDQCGKKLESAVQKRETPDTMNKPEEIKSYFSKLGDIFYRK